MAGYRRSTRRRGVDGKTRREHLPPDQAAAAARRRAHQGARNHATDRISRTTDPLRKLDVAREYVRSAAAKFQSDGQLAAAVDALLAAGDRIFQSGDPLTPAQKRTRRERAARHRAQRRETEVLLREGRASVRRQQREARRSE